MKHSVNNVEERIYSFLMCAMPLLALVVFAALFFVHAGYGMFRSRSWGFSIPNKAGWVIMEAPAFIVMLCLWLNSNVRFEIPEFIFFLLFEIHYFQRSFVFPILMRGKSRMPISIILMGLVFNIINGFLLAMGLFYFAPQGKYDETWVERPIFWIGVLLFIAGMLINIHSDHVIRTLRQPGDTRHYLPQKGMYKWVTSGNYFGELLDWIGFAVLTQCNAAYVFVIWTFANLAPRAYAIRKKYIKEFGNKAVGNRKCLIPYIF